MKRVFLAVAIVLSFSARAANTLRIVSAGPVGETSTLAEANEVRVVFSEPMVALGRIPQPVAAGFFHITPAVKGSFRWSGTTTLIFTPDKPLPFATEYAVTIDKSAKAVSGNTLDQPYNWSFATPAVKVIAADWYRKKSGAVVLALNFNQPVQASAVLPKLRLRTQGHPLELPQNPAGDPAFEAKKAKAIAAAASEGQTVLAFVSTDYDKERFPLAPERFVVETRPDFPLDTWIRVGETDIGYTIELGQTLFVNGIDCSAECDPESRNAINFRSGPGLRFAEVRKAVTVSDITDPAKETKLEPKKVTPEYDSPSWSYGLDELGYSLLPGRSYRVTVAPTLTAEDHQTLGYTFTSTIENWHKSAFVSFGSGHGVWEATGGPVLPFHARNFRTAKQWLAPLTIEQIMPTMVKLRESGFNVTPDAKPTRSSPSVSTSSPPSARTTSASSGRPFSRATRRRSRRSTIPTPSRPSCSRRTSASASRTVRATR
jgi:hypothetical protein